ncbi:MAG: TIR domain-containing protein [Pseudomonadota bacterium]
MKQVFISHAPEDRGVLESFQEVFRQAGLKPRIWEQPPSAGEVGSPAIGLLQECAGVLTLLSRAALVSEAVRHETAVALRSKPTLVLMSHGVSMDNVASDWPRGLEQRLVGRFDQRPTEELRQTLAQRLRAAIGGRRPVF